MNRKFRLWLSLSFALAPRRVDGRLRRTRGRPGHGAPAPGTQQHLWRRRRDSAWPRRAGGPLSARDADWYSFDVDHQGELALALTAVPAALDLNVRVWNADKATISDWIAPLALGETRPAPSTWRSLAAISWRSSTAQTMPPPNRPTPSAPISRPRQTQANPTTPSAPRPRWNWATPANANILPAGDVDWYAVQVDDRGALQVEITDVAPALAVNVRVLELRIASVVGDWIAPLAPGGDTRGSFDLPVAGRYLLEVSPEAASAAPSPTA